MQHRSTISLFVAFALLALQGCAVTLNNADVFTLRDRHLPTAALQLDPKLDRARVTEVSLAAATRLFLGYRYSAPNPTRALLFFPGNGYGAPSAVSRLVQTFGDGETDVYILSYGQPGEALPKVSQVYAMGRELAAYASTVSRVPPSRVIAMGHSLGGWVALDLASTDRIGCAVIVGTGTTAAETATQLVPKPMSWFAKFESSPDVALLNNIEQAKRSRTPTLVVGSVADEIMPPNRSRAIYEQLDPRLDSELYVSSDATHGGYFRNNSVVEKMQSFTRSKCDA